ncbi:MAG: hypothetical protein U0Y10_03235 [Spirosomataceae bacterium]
MLYFIFIVPTIMALVSFGLNNNPNLQDRVKNSLRLFLVIFPIFFALWLFVPLFFFSQEKDTYLTEILNKTSIPPTLATIVAIICALVSVGIVWNGKLVNSPMRLIIANAIPTIFFLTLQFFVPNIAKGCVVTNPATGLDEDCDCDYADGIHAKYNQPIRKKNSALNRVNANENTVFFSKDGRSLFYYSQDASGKIDIFDQLGTTPQGNTTQPVTREIVQKYLSQINQKTSQPQANVEKQTQETEPSVSQHVSDSKPSVQEQAKQQVQEPPRYVNLIANPSFENLPNSQEIVVVAVNGDNQIESGLASQIAATFKNKGYRATSAFFKSSFVGDGHFEDMYQDGQELVRAIGLSNYADKVCLVKYNVKTRPNDYGQTTADASLQIHVLSTSNGRVNDSISLTESGFGFTEFEAKNTVIQKLIQRLSSQL